MELTYEEWKAAKKDLRRRFSTSGWVLLIYYAIMNVTVLFCTYVGVVYQLILGENPMAGGASDTAYALGYFFAAAVGFLILLIWKGTPYLRQEIFYKGAPMKAGSFFTVLCIFISGQMIFQLGTTLMEVILNSFGYTLMEGLESIQTDSDDFGMFLYAGLLAPITEEILFRGLIQRPLLPYGKKFAIFVSSFTFGLFHGNLIQTPYAFVVGLVLGYVAAEYNILWSMVLHMINNLVLGDLLYRVLGAFPEDTVNLIVWGIILAFTVMAVILAVQKRREIAAWLRKEQMVRAYMGCYFSCAGTIVLLIVLGLNIITTTFMLVTPLT